MHEYLKQTYYNRKANLSSNKLDSFTNLENEVLKIVNEERKKVDLPPLFNNKQLNLAARQRAKEQSIKFAHRRPSGDDCFTIIKQYNIKCSGMGENLAMGQTSPSQVMECWMNSEGHRKNILYEKFREMGVGLYIDINKRYYWAQIFIY